VSRLNACVHAHTRTHTHTHTHTHTRTHAHTQACTHAHTHTLTPARTHTHTYTYTYTYTHTHTHTQTHTHMYKRAQSTRKLPVHSAKGFANFSASLAMLPPTCHVSVPNIYDTSSPTYLILFLKVISKVLFFNMVR